MLSLTLNKLQPINLVKCVSGYLLKLLLYNEEVEV